MVESQEKIKLEGREGFPYVQTLEKTDNQGCSVRRYIVSRLISSLDRLV